MFSLLALCTPNCRPPPPHYTAPPQPAERARRGKNSPNLFTFDPDFCSRRRRSRRRRRRRRRRHGTSMISQGKIGRTRECECGEERGERDGRTRRVARKRDSATQQLLSLFSSLVPIGHGGITLCPGVPVCLPARSPARPPSPLGRPEASAGKAIESKSPIPSPTLPSFLPSFLVCFSRRRRRVVGSEDDFNRLFPSLRPNLAPLDRRLLGAALRFDPRRGGEKNRTWGFNSPSGCGGGAGGGGSPLRVAVCASPSSITPLYSPLGNVARLALV